MKGELEWRPGDNELKSLASLPRIIPEPEPAKTEPPRKTPHSYVFKEPVVDSTHIKWKPIDKVAARVVAAAPWHCQPPQPEPKFMNEQKLERIVGPDGKIAGSGRVRTKMGMTEDGHVEELINMKDVAYPATESAERDAADAVRKTEELRNRAQEAWDSVDYLLSHVREPTEQYLTFIRQALVTVREQKMALQTETRGLMSALREVREFFLEDKHEEEVKRLMEFVDLCERLKKLKDSGFLDTVAETMLRL